MAEAPQSVSFLAAASALRFLTGAHDGRRNSFVDRLRDELAEIEAAGTYKREKAVDQEAPVFTNKFQHLLNFAFDNTSSELPLPPTPSQQPETTPELSSLDLLDGIN
ncbi:hypothetical protein PR003_g11883 [Phytophthora rubi]|uniref:Uncharacterized protein n=1 Tax=Phytophthora rubi TaxID=129364 RepID=A0A6A3MEJ9_9STRA|nr:hypothetical protein PR002_g11286 [Phytophthora rubi]KAE9030841.1 hypothetical protein PR001_g11149 [Phytophthora rubi]KAE9337688.1 hypothetical protein PR003_g11883 [Phytophthora rubi]